MTSTATAIMPKLIKIPFKVTFSNQLRDDLAFGILYQLIPNHKMATPFCDLKTLTGFGF
jgi:hypothetical protein